MKRKNPHNEVPLSYEDLRARLEEAEETLEAIRNHEVDALIMGGAEEQKVFTLEGADQPYRFFIECMNEGAVTMTLDGVVLHCNTRFAEMLERPLNRIMGNSFYDFLAARDGISLKEMVRECGLQGCKGEFLLGRSNGRGVPVQLSARPLSGEMEVICVVITDLTDLKEAEEALRRSKEELDVRVEERTAELHVELEERKKVEDALRLSQRRWVTTLASIGDAVIATDKAGMITFMNRVAEELTGWRHEDAIMKPVARVFHIVGRETRQKVDDPVATVLRDGVVVGLANNTILIRKDGTEVPIDDSGAPIRSREGESMGAVLIFRDITERVQREEERKRYREELELRVQERTSELQKAYDTLETETEERARLEDQLRQAQKMEAIGTLAGGIAHDFNNILAGIIGFTEMALEDLTPDSQVYRYMEYVLKGGYRARDMVRQILAFSRRTGQEKTPIAVSQVVEESLKLLRPALPSTVEIQKRLQHVQDTILADPVQLHQIIMNLCSNAAHAMRDGGGVLRITLSDADITGEEGGRYPDLKPGTYLQLSVSDTGCGIAPDVIDRIFDPFFTTKAPGEGTGMGLSVVHGIVNSHGGNVIVYSEPGKGSTFHVYLPKTEIAAAVTPESLSAIEGGHECILFVDDEEVLVELNTQRLEGLGYSVVAAMNGADALETFAAEPARFDLVITDYTMPHMTGVDLAGKLLEVRPDIPIILSSGFNEKAEPETIRQAGIKAFITKTAGKRELAELIRQVLKK
jgi:PAS domain S-box-containing protein